MLPSIDESLDLAVPERPPEAPPPEVQATRQVSSRDAFYTPQSSNVRLKSFLWILPGERGLRLLAVAAVVLLLWRYGGRSLSVEPADRRALPSAARIANLAGAGVVPRDAGRWEKRRAWGGGLELEYVYEARTRDEPGVRALLWVDDSEEEARATFRKLNLNTAVDWGLMGADPVGLLWLDERRPLGSESRVYRVVLERAVLGHSIAVRRGCRTVYAKIEGDFLTDAQALSLACELLGDLHAVVVPD